MQAGHNGTATRDLLRISSRPTLMPSLREESEDNPEESESSGSHVKQSCDQNNKQVAEKQLDALNTSKTENNNNSAINLALSKHVPAMNRSNGESVRGLPMDLATKLRIQQALSGNNSPSLYEFYENNMDLSPTGRHPNNNLIGVPQHFLNNSSSVNSEPSSPEPSPKANSNENSNEQALNQASTKSAKGDNSNTPSMPPQSSAQKHPSSSVDSNQNNEDGINLNSSGDTKPSDNVEESGDTRSTISNSSSHQPKVFGRFSGADERIAKYVCVIL